uniref:Uncharacterized protein n=1 Tax=viral metagenome TaxID=1070528 RepID=A0A6M3K4J9_9ZZZZ
MSTVQNIFDSLPTRLTPGDDPSALYPLLNYAIRTIAKRLYRNGSDVLRGELSVKAYKLADITGTDIAFTDDDPDTIACTTSNFLSDGFQSGMHITVELYHADDDISFDENDSADTITTAAGNFETAGFAAGQIITVSGSGSNDGTYQIVSVSGGVITLAANVLDSDEDAGEDVVISVAHPDNPGPFEIDTVDATTITLISTDSLTAVAAGQSIKIKSDNTYGDLPTDFWGLGNFRPYINGKKWRLLPSPGEDYEVKHTDAGQSRYYRIDGMRINVYPPTASDITIKGPYFQKPTAIAAVATTMPFNELFDDAIAEVFMFFHDISGPANLIEIEKYLNRAVDDITTRRGRKGATPFPTAQEGVDYDNAMVD